MLGELCVGFPYAQLSEGERLAASRDFFTSADWFRSFDQHVPIAGQQVLTISLSGPPGLKGLLPLAAVERGGLFEGKDLRSLSNFYSPLYGPCVTDCMAAPTVSDFVAAAPDVFREFDRVQIVPVFEDGALEWCDALRPLGFHCHKYVHTLNWYHDNLDGVDRYWASRPSRVRNTVKRRAEKLRREGGYTFEIASPVSEFELLARLRQYHDVYFNSWKRLEAYPGFIDAVSIAAWRSGQLRLGMCYLHGRAIAAQLWFVVRKRAYIFKLCHRRDVSEKSVGTLLTAHMLNHVLQEDSVASIDFLTGDEAYKQDWMRSRRALYGVEASNLRTLRGLANSCVNACSSGRARLMGSLSSTGRES